MKSSTLLKPSTAATESNQNVIANIPGPPFTKSHATLAKT